MMSLRRTAPHAAPASLPQNFTVGNAVLGEIIMTFVLCFVVHMCAVDKTSPCGDNGLAPLAIGFAVFLGHAVLIPLDG